MKLTLTLQSQLGEEPEISEEHEIKTMNLMVFMEDFYKFIGEHKRPYQE